MCRREPTSTRICLCRNGEDIDSDAIGIDDGRSPLPVNTTPKLMTDAEIWAEVAALESD